MVRGACVAGSGWWAGQTVVAKEADVFGRDAWAGMSRAGEEAGGAGCGGSWAWGRAGLALAEAGVQAGRRIFFTIEKSRDALIVTQPFRTF